VSAVTDTRDELGALVCDAVGTLISPAGGLVADDAAAALDRARAAGLLVAVVHDGWPDADLPLPFALAGVDLVTVPRAGDRGDGRRGEVRPRFVRRTCRRLGVEPAACVVIGARRPLLAAAAWVGARTVMVPNDATPLFDVRGHRHVAPDLATAIDGLLAGVGAR
jgi:beta-phosphoglucomutase-like phosphatase (HAD superfamily)